MLTGLSTTVWKQVAAELLLAVVVLYGMGLSQTNPTPTHPLAVPPEIRPFVPPTAIFIKQLSVRFEKESEPSIAVAYAIPDNNRYDFTTTVRILKRERPSGLTVAFDESEVISNGGGPFDAIRIEVVSSEAGKEAVVVILKTSGAGTTTDWHVIAAVGGKFVTLDPKSIGDRVLKHRKYVFMGYNGVTSKGDLVIEDVPGYSPGRARCCPDRPSIDVIYKFTGDSIKLQSVKELPFTPLE